MSDIKKAVFICLLHALLTWAGWVYWRYLNLQTSLIDSGFFTQQLWWLAQGKLPLSAINPPYFPDAAWAFHFSPVISFFTPLTWLPHPPVWLNLGQSLALGMSALPIFLIARNYGYSGKKSFLWILVYLFSPFICNAALNDFHEQALGTLFMAWGLYFVVVKNYLRLWLCCILLLLTKEHYGLAVSGFGILWGHYHREWKRGLFLVVSGLLAIGLILKIIMPFFGGGDVGNEVIASRYGWMHNIDSFVKTIGYLFEDGYGYVILLLAPFLFLPLLGWFWCLPAAADLAANLLSINPMPRSFFSYHGMSVAPVLTVATIYAVHKINRHYLLYVILSWSLILGYFLSLAPLPYAGGERWKEDPEFSAYRFSNLKNISEINELLNDDDIVSAQANIGTYFVMRAQIYPFPVHMENADVIILHQGFPYLDKNQDFFNAPYATMSNAEYYHKKQIMVSGGNYELIYNKNEWLVFRRKSDPQL